MGYMYYAPQLKTRHFDKYERGQSLTEANTELETTVSKRSIQRWNALVRDTGSLIRAKADYETQGRPPIYNQADIEVLYDVIQEDPTLFLDEIQEIMFDIVGKKPCISSVRSAIIKHLGFTLKEAGTVDPNQSLEMRAEYLRRVAHLPSQYLVFLDEVGANERDLFRKYIRSKKGTRGERLLRSRQGTHWTMCAAVCEDGMIAGVAIEDSFDRMTFEDFLEYVLLPRMNRYPDRNSVLIMDNAPIHKRGNVERLAFDVGVLLIYLPTFSPDMNPIEKAFSVFKAHFIRTGNFLRAEDKAACLLQTGGEIFTAELITSLIRGGGYAPAV